MSHQISANRTAEKWAEQYRAAFDRWRKSKSNQKLLSQAVITLLLQEQGIVLLIIVSSPLSDISCISGWEWLTNQTDPVLYYFNMLSSISIVLAHRSNSPQVGMSSHLDTLFWLWTNQCAWQRSSDYQF